MTLLNIVLICPQRGWLHMQHSINVPSCLKHYTCEVHVM